ncbi:hypothetical protein BGX26_009041, partial [Mortierella sp. AD094]
MFNGRYHYHALNYQVVATPDGMIVHLGEAQPGTMHDYRMYLESGLQELLAQEAFDIDGESLGIYGDLAYHLDGHMMRPFDIRPGMPVEERRFNIAMARER